MKKKNNISEQKVYLNKKLGGMPSFYFYQPIIIQKSINQEFYPYFQ